MIFRAEHSESQPWELREIIGQNDQYAPLWIQNMTNWIMEDCKCVSLCAELHADLNSFRSLLLLRPLTSYFNQCSEKQEKNEGQRGRMQDDTKRKQENIAATIRQKGN